MAFNCIAPPPSFSNHMVMNFNWHHFITQYTTKFYQSNGHCIRLYWVKIDVPNKLRDKKIDVECIVSSIKITVLIIL